MVKSFKSINDAVMQEIYAYEEQKKLKFEQELCAVCTYFKKIRVDIYNSIVSLD